MKSLPALNQVYLPQPSLLKAGELSHSPAHGLGQLPALPDQKAWPEHLDAAWLSNTEAECLAGRADHLQNKASDTGQEPWYVSWL